MSIPISNSELDFFDPHHDSGKPDVMLAAVLYLMSAYAKNGGCPKLAHVILRHLELIAHRSDVPSVVTSTCGQLALHWEQTLHDALPQARAAATNQLGGRSGCVPSASQAVGASHVADFAASQPNASAHFAVNKTLH